jgi:hypothetical protein
MLDQRKIKFEHVKEENLELVSVFFFISIFYLFFCIYWIPPFFVLSCKDPHNNIVYFEIKIK